MKTIALFVFMIVFASSSYTQNKTIKHETIQAKKDSSKTSIYPFQLLLINNLSSLRT